MHKLTQHELATPLLRPFPRLSSTLGNSLTNQMYTCIHIVVVVVTKTTGLCSIVYWHFVQINMNRFFFYIKSDTLCDDILHKSSS